MARVEPPQPISHFALGPECRTPQFCKPESSSLKRHWYLQHKAKIGPSVTSHLLKELCSPPVNVFCSRVGHFFLDTWPLEESLGIPGETRESTYFIHSVLPPHLMGSTAEMLCSVPKSNRPSEMRDWTQALDGLVKFQAIVLAIENSPAKNGTHLYIVTDPLATANDLGASSINHSSLSKVTPFGIKKSESNASQYPSPNQ